MENYNLFLNSYVQRISQHFSLQDSFAFEILAISAILEKDFDEVFNNISTIENSSGSNDGGMDGVYIVDEEGNFTLDVFQVKYSDKDLGDNEIRKFINDYTNLFVNDNAANIPLNNKTKRALDRYRALIISHKVPHQIRLHFVFNGDKETIENTHRSEQHHQADNRLHFYGRQELYNKIAQLALEGRKRKEVKFKFEAEKSNISLRNDPQALISFQIGNVKAINFRLKVLDLCALLDKEKEINGSVEYIFSENIRGFLSNKTNAKIRETLEGQTPEYFPFLNNGITIIADRVIFPEEPAAGRYPVEVTNPSIVNGLQTSNVIYSIYQEAPAKLADVYVMVRLYETSQPELVEQITDATNTQTPINFRDKISKKSFNTFTSALFENHGVRYITKRGDTFKQNSIPTRKSIESETALKFWYASFNKLPEIAKNSKSKVLEDIYEASVNKEHKLHSLFNGDKQSPIYQELWKSYTYYTFVIEKRNSEENRDKEVLSFADEILCYAIFMIIKDSNRQKTIEQSYTEALNALIKIVKKEKINHEAHNITYSHNNYFKSSKSRHDLNAELNLFTSE